MLDARHPDMPVRIDAKSRAPHVAVTSLIQNDVFDDTGRRVGEIEEIILDARTGCARYVVLRFGGFLGIGRKRFAVPWWALTPNLDYRRFVLDVARMSLMAVPVLDDDSWLQSVQRRDGQENSISLRRPSFQAAAAIAANDA
jgi:sporulation protein YlmC with PRC-barrel domain